MPTLLPRRLLFVLLTAPLLYVSVQPRPALAQLRVDGLHQRSPALFQHLMSPRMNAGKPARLIVRDSALRASMARVSIGHGFSLIAASDADGTTRAFWAPPKRLLLNEATKWIAVDEYRAQLLAEVPDAEPQSTGTGVVVGIVDGGIDFTHPDLQNTDGSTRVAWFLDFTTGPLGYHADLEDELGCTQADSPCAVLSAEQIDIALNADPAVAAVLLPDDRLGHGTHVASLAAGSGRSDARYRGVAPDATLVVARLSSGSSDVQDADVVLATRFVYEQADALGMPAVANLSLGGDFGPHDGSTMLEQALVGFLDVPGRAMVVAAGNSAGMFEDGPKALPGPFGVHTDVYVDGSERVEVVLPNEQPSYDADILVWVDTPTDDQLSVAVSSDGKPVIRSVSAGQYVEGKTADWDAAVSNQSSFDDSTLVDYERGVLVILTGTFQANEIVELQLNGKGPGSLWLQSAGDLGPEAGSRGALFSAARRGGTITVPATAPELIAVGATLNRNTWPSRVEGTAMLSLFSDQLDETPGSVAFFSSLGPNQLGLLKPDILAPGAVVIGAMAASADPTPASGRDNFTSMFAGSPVCDEELMCAVVDNAYGVAIGTSMAAPIVTGAVALLLAANPALTQSELRGLLQTGATRIAKSTTTPKEEADLPPAPGLLNLARSQFATTDMGSPAVAPDPAHSWITLSDTYIAPSRVLHGIVRVRDADDLPLNVDLSDLTLEVSHGQIEAPLTKRAPGLLDFSVRADSLDLVSVDSVGAVASDGATLSVSIAFNDERLARVKVPLTLDLNTLRGLRVTQTSLRETSSCQLTPGAATPAGRGLAVLLLGLFGLRRRHARS